MYAIAFDMEISKLKEYYGVPYNKAYLQIKSIMKDASFEWVQGSLYISKDEQNTLANVYKAINKLSKICTRHKSI
jgi:virulence-associated protein VapD